MKAVNAFDTEKKNNEKETGKKLIVVKYATTKHRISSICILFEESLPGDPIRCYTL
jgi:hypothetical protein